MIFYGSVVRRVPSGQHADPTRDSRIIPDALSTMPRRLIDSKSASSPSSQQLQTPIRQQRSGTKKMSHHANLRSTGCTCAGHRRISPGAHSASSSAPPDPAMSAYERETTKPMPRQQAGIWKHVISHRGACTKHCAVRDMGDDFFLLARKAGNSKHPSTVRAQSKSSNRRVRPDFTCASTDIAAYRPSPRQYTGLPRERHAYRTVTAKRAAFARCCLGCTNEEKTHMQLALMSASRTDGK